MVLKMSEEEFRKLAQKGHERVGAKVTRLDKLTRLERQERILRLKVEQMSNRKNL